MLSAGLSMEGIEPEVWNMLQPPFSTGSRLAVRWIMVPQSIGWKSTFMPRRFIRSAVTWPKAPSCG